MKVHFDGWSVRGSTHPNIEIFALPRLEKKDVIAIVEVGKLIKLVKFCLCVKLGIFATMWKKGIYVVQ